MPIPKGKTCGCKEPDCLQLSPKREKERIDIRGGRDDGAPPGQPAELKTTTKESS